MDYRDLKDAAYEILTTAETETDLVVLRDGWLKIHDATVDGMNAEARSDREATDRQSPG